MVPHLTTALAGPLQELEQQILRQDAALVELAMSEDYPAEQVLIPEGEEWVMPAGAFRRGGGPS